MFQPFRLLVLVVMLLPAESGLGQEFRQDRAGQTEEWAEPTAALFLAYEPALVPGDDIRRRAAETGKGLSGRALAEAIVADVAGTVMRCPDGREEKTPHGAAATATLAAQCGSDMAAAVLAVSLMRTRGLDAQLALASCRRWSSPAALDDGPLAALVTWRPPGGQPELVPGPPGSALALPLCPWGAWLPLVPVHGRPRPLPTPEFTGTVHRLVKERKTPQDLADVLVRCRRVVTGLVESWRAPYPLHISWRESWPADPEQFAGLRPVRVSSDVGFVAATLTVRAGRATLAVDVRIYASPAVSGEARLHGLLSALPGETGDQE